MGFFKEKDCFNNIATDDEFIVRIIEGELLLIPRQFFNHAYDTFLFRCHQCLATDGRQFEWSLMLKLYPLLQQL